MTPTLQEVYSEVLNIKRFLFNNDQTDEKGVVSKVNKINDQLAEISIQLTKALALQEDIKSLEIYHGKLDKRVEALEDYNEKNAIIKNTKKSIFIAAGAIFMWVIEHSWAGIVKAFGVLFR